ncbi:MAG: DNA (cytosine-5-)-methyltransferase [Oscillospiraceae bacterium]|nr:DNA (cytosine-5-)-methyltransferase [Oscillospiraceae bacterium]
MPKPPPTTSKHITFIDLFAGIGGMRKGFELACQNRGLNTTCIFTSENKPSAVKILKQNNPDDEVYGDITQIDESSIPDFDFLLAGFPCQAFSSAGKRLGFFDTRGTLFFDVERILKEKKPFGFVLENVEGLVNHDRESKHSKIGRTLLTILESLRNLGYKVTWNVLDAKNFGIPQERKRIYIVGTRTEFPNIDCFDNHHSVLNSVLEQGLPCRTSKFVELLLSHFSPKSLYGKAIKDKRGGDNNIHSWDIELRGSTSQEQRELLSRILRERRKKKWAEEYGIDWMDGMPLTFEHIHSFYESDTLDDMLQDLVNKKYLKMEYPKRKIGNKRVQDNTLPIGYNIVAGKKSFEISKILDPNGIAPTLVAMDMEHLFVVDGAGLRCLTLREGLRLFGFPDDFKFDIECELGYDLLGNTVVVPVVTAVAERVIDEYLKEISNEINPSRNL